MKLSEIYGTYGSGKTPCTVFLAETNRGTWYAVEGSRNVNFTRDKINSGVNVETLSDVDFFTAAKEIDSLEEFENQINN
jgi:hypothetical protein